MNKLFLLALCFSAVAAGRIGAAMPPGCEEKIAAATKGLADADTKLAAANQAFAATATEWNDKLNADGKAVSEASDARVKAGNALAPAQDAINAAKTTLMSDQNKLNAEELKCATSVPKPDDCDSTIDALTKQVAKDNDAVDSAKQAYAAVNKTNTEAQAALDQALATQKSDIAEKDDAIKAAQADIDSAVEAQKQAQKDYNDVVKECSGSEEDKAAYFEKHFSRFSSSTTPECEKELKDASDALKAATASIDAANSKFGADAKTFDDKLTKDGTVIKQKADAKTAAAQKLAPAMDAVNKATNQKNSDQNALDAEKMKCSVSVPPPKDCNSTIKELEGKLAEDDKALTDAKKAYNETVAADDEAQAELDAAQKVLEGDEKARDTTLKSDQTAIDAAIQNQKTAQENYNAVVKKCAGAAKDKAAYFAKHMSHLRI